MPPRKRASPSASPEPDTSGAESDKPKTTKKAKKEPKPKEPVKPLNPDLPHNTALPPDLKPYGGKEEGVIRLATYNVCGINASVKKGLLQYLEAEDADVVVLCETKTADPSIADIEKRYEHRYWGADPKKGNAGTAVLSKIKPLSVVFGLPTSEEPLETHAGRIVTLEFENTHLIGTYVVNAGQGLKTMDKKEAWNEAFEKYLRELDAKKPVIWTGDINSVQTEKDIRNWKTNYNKSAGCTEKEILALHAQLNPDPASGHKKLVDVWRYLHPDAEGYYTYFSYKFQCRVKGIGWRLDTFILSERILANVKQCEIRLEIYGASDHVPVILDVEGPL